MVLLPLVALLLRYRGFRRTEKVLAGMSRHRREKTGDAAARRARQAGRMVGIAAARGPRRSQCLEQAITVWWLLGLMGVDSRVRLGIYKKDEQVEAHAWVLYEDEIVIGQFEGMDDYEPILDVNVERR